MADATREILLKIAATADVTQINALNKTLRETTDIALRLRNALKDPFTVATAGMQQMAQGSTAAAAGQKNIAARTKEIAEEAARAAANIREAYNLTKTTEATYYGKRKTTETTRESFTGAGGLTATITSRGEEVKAITQTVDAARREKEIRAEGRQMLSAEAEDRRRSIQVMSAQAVMSKDVARRDEEVYRWRRMVSRAEREMASTGGGPVYRGADTFRAIAAQPNSTVSSSQVLNQQTGELNKVLTVTNSLTGAQFSLNTSTGRLTGGFRQMNAAVQESGDTMQNAMAKVALWTVATGIVFGTVRAIKSMVSTFGEVESGSVALQRVGRGFGDTLEEVQRGSKDVTSELLKMGVELGARSSETREAAVNFARLGLTQSQTVEAVRTSMVAANVANIDLVQSSKLLASAMQQFGLQASDLPSMLNKLNTMENTTRTTTADMLEAISRSGAVWREAGGSLEEFNATVAVVSQATGRTGAEIGNAFKTIASRMADMNVQKDIFQKTGVAVSDVAGRLRPIGQILEQVAQKMGKLTEQERLELTTQMAGIRQRNILQAALDNYGQIQSQVTRQIESAGSAEQENELVMGTLEKKLAQLAASFERLSVSLGKSGIADLLKLFVDAIRKSIDAIANMGRAGALLIAGFVLYAGAVLAATLQTTAFGRSLALLWVGAGRVNTALISMVTAQTATAASNARTTASNAMLAKSYDIVTASAGRATVASAAASGSGAVAAARTAGAFTVGQAARGGLGGIARFVPHAMAIYAATEIMTHQFAPDDNSSKYQRQLRAADDMNNKQWRRQILQEEKADVEKQQAYYKSITGQAEQGGLGAKLASWWISADDKAAKYATRLKEINTELNQVDTQKALADQADQAEAAANAVKVLHDRLKEIEGIDKGSLLGISVEADPVKKAERELAVIERRAKETLSSKEYANLKATNPDEAKKVAEKQSDDVQDARLKAAEARIKKEADIRQKSLQDRVNHNRSLARLLAPEGPDSTKQIREGQAELEQVERERKVLSAREATLRGSLTEKAHIMASWGANPEHRGEADALMKRALGFGLDDYRDMVAELAAVTQEGRRMDEEASSLSMQIEQRRLEMIVRESEERQKQYETTRREMGQMSDMDLVRTTLMANKLKSGDYKQMSERDLLFMPQQSRQFLGRFEQMFPGAPRVMPDMARMAPPEWYSRQETPKLPNYDLDYLRSSFKTDQNFRVAVEMGSLGAEGDRLAAAVQAGVTQAILGVSEMWIERANRPANAAKQQAQPR